jgi:PhnB protein
MRMREINAYLTFDGNCREAMQFYAQCLGGELNLMPFRDADRIMHARIQNGEGVLMASDTMPGMPLRQGNNFSVVLNCESPDEIERLFNAIGENGKVTMPLHDAFWGARFGMLTDRFGIQWMFNFEKRVPCRTWTGCSDNLAVDT